MKTKKILSFALIFSLFLMVLNIALAENKKINIDLNNNGNINEIAVSNGSIEIYKNDQDNNPNLTHKFEYDTRKITMFNQYSPTNAYSEILTGQDISKVINLKQEAENARYGVIYASFSKEKFIIADVNRDGLSDFIKVKEPSPVNPDFYEQSIYYQGKNCSFSNKPDKIIRTQRSSFITGLYYDINNDGLPDKIEIRYKHYGALLGNTKCIMYIYLLKNGNNKYNEEPDMRIISRGVFYADINFRDINKDGYPDIVIVDIPKETKSLQDAISKLLERRMNISLKFYLYDKRAKGYPLAPTFVKKINVDILQDFTISLDDDFNSDGYKDLLITQSNHSEKYLFDPQRYIFKEQQFK